MPASVYNTVGVTSSVSPIDPPVVTKGQPLLTYTTSSGTTLPGVYFYGAEYCPYCAAERWVIITALSRFGTFKGLDNMQSSSTDIFPSTQTFTFVDATYTSKYIVFHPEEYYSNQVNASGSGYTVLQPFKGNDEKLVGKYDTNTYFPSSPPTGRRTGFPFIDIGNKVLSSTNYAPEPPAERDARRDRGGLERPQEPGDPGHHRQRQLPGRRHLLRSPSSSRRRSARARACWPPLRPSS